MKNTGVSFPEHGLVYETNSAARPFDRERDGSLPRYSAAMRVSTTMQDTDQQFRDIIYFLRCRHPDTGFVVVERLDEARSGAAEDLRSIFGLINRARVYGSSIVVAKTDRLHRSQRNELRINTYLEERGVPLLVADGIPEAVRPLAGFIASMERDMIRDRVRRSMATRRAAGLCSYLEACRPGPLTAVGVYKSVHRRQLRAQQRRDGAARQVLRLHQQGMSRRKIVAAMDTATPRVTEHVVRSILAEHKSGTATYLQADDDIATVYGGPRLAATEAKMEAVRARLREARLIRVGYSLEHNASLPQSVRVRSAAETPPEIRAEAKRAYAAWIDGLYRRLMRGKCVDAPHLVTKQLLLRSRLPPEGCTDAQIDEALAIAKRWAARSASANRA